MYIFNVIRYNREPVFAYTLTHCSNSLVKYLREVTPFFRKPSILSELTWPANQTIGHAYQNGNSPLNGNTGCSS